MDIDTSLLMSPPMASGRSGSVLQDMAAKFKQHMQMAGGGEPPSPGKDAAADALASGESERTEWPKYAEGTSVEEIEKDLAARWDELDLLAQKWLAVPMPKGVAKAPLASMIANGGTPVNATVNFEDIPGSSEWLGDFDYPVPPHVRAMEECPGATCIRMPADYDYSLYKSYSQSLRNAP